MDTHPHPSPPDVVFALGGDISLRCRLARCRALATCPKVARLTDAEETPSTVDSKCVGVEDSQCVPTCPSPAHPPPPQVVVVSNLKRRRVRPPSPQAERSEMDQKAPATASISEALVLIE